MARSGGHAADAAYMREWRRRNPDGQKRNRLGVGARRRAMERLAARYSDEFYDLVVEERSAVGLPPHPRVGRPRQFDGGET